MFYKTTTSAIATLQYLTYCEDKTIPDIVVSKWDKKVGIRSLISTSVNRDTY